MTPQELKNSILQLAIQGKLTDQRPEDGTGEDLFRQIQAEKQALIRDGKIKKEKPLPEITENEKPFDIPDSWKWVHISEVFSIIMGQSPDGNSVSEGSEGIEFHQGKIYFSKIIIEKSLQKTITPTKIAPAGSVLLCVRAPVGKVNITDREICIGRGLAAIVGHANIFPMFIYYWFSTLEPIFIKKSTGTTFKAISGDIIEKQTIPLPPLAEQHRIVAKIDELLPLVDQYAAAWTRLEEFNQRFPIDFQKSLLQMAIQGKLTDQRPEEGTGEDLYREIQKEKVAFIKAGKIKKEKPLPEITEDEKPFDIPVGWSWVRLNDLAISIGDGIHGTPEFCSDGGYFFVNGNNLDNGIIRIKSDTQAVSENEYNKYRKPLNDNTILISINGTIGNIAYYNNEPIILGKSACYITLISHIFKYYIRVILESDFFIKYAVKEATQTTIKNVSLKAIRMLPIPLPPLAEQKRIVARLEELLPLCEKCILMKGRKKPC